ncbi:MAG: DUF1365 domain-containing protein [Rhodospirillaceae bacterium]|jgi:DUF1365 family protein|nr:DUF1365 domain-containing protein [Rhodospirillaceae bacterium]MBT5242337.1 DUF1365 domain-containing protein [Rhodospirillaceae bacterium]MBT5567278.1 DUF1365 domain-containing protein [Rhodospirillaceae bacterium]MBT6087949.1 DUF1365 domain-containing protein [Rhodospirillaceae bacterium]
MTALASSLYTGKVMHRRTRPKKHRLAYDVFALLVDLDELPAMDKSMHGFAYNRFSLLSFYNRDHGPGTDEPLRVWIESILANANLSIEGGPIRLLCYPRMLGYSFNPLSNYFCYKPDGTLVAVLHEVSNTFGERHCYLFDTSSDDGLVRHSVKKCFYVSPFIEMDMTYNFRIRPPADDISVAIQETDADGTLLFASFGGTRQPLSAWTMVKAFFAYPMMTLKVVGGIHWEAVKLWRKGVPLVARPKPPKDLVTYASHETG